MIVHGDCVEAMAAMEADSIDAIVTDPPYGLEFMGKEWDDLGKSGVQRKAEGGGGDRRAIVDADEWAGGESSPYSRSRVRWQHGNAGPAAMQEWHQAWAIEALRVLKPGGHLLAFGGTRTYHRLACAVEDAGFEIRDSVIWLYGSGFPKSLDVSKAIDKAAGVEREVIGESPYNARRPNPPVSELHQQAGWPSDLTAPATPEAQKWNGWGTALKPAHEPIVVARKPLIGTVAENCLAHGTGALNVDGCRIETDPNDPVHDAVWTTQASGFREGSTGTGFLDGSSQVGDRRSAAPPAAGRWPANVTLSHLPECEAVGTRKVATGMAVRRNIGHSDKGSIPFATGSKDAEMTEDVTYGEDGTETVIAYNCAEGCPVDSIGEVSRFFFTSEPWKYAAKASRAERNAGLTAGPNDVPVFGDDGGTYRGLSNSKRPQSNGHPTVKPIDLMRWLVRLVTPPDGTVLDPFAGSGTTGCAAMLEGVDFIGIEREAEYVEIAKARIEWWAQHQGREADEVLAITRKSEAMRDDAQVALF